jgi:predicted HicB family RNase H-like nuclease
MPDKGKKTVSKAQQKAVAKYENKVYDKFLVRITKGKKSELQAHATVHGESLNAFVNRAIDEAVERDEGTEAPVLEPVEVSPQEGPHED